MKYKIFKNIPNFITVSRIITSLLASLSFILGNFGLSIGLYIYSASSDFFDGFLARKLNAFSELGRKLDAISDKLFMLSLLLPTIILGNYLMLIPFVFESLISLNNLKSNKQNIRIVTERVGKFKTAMLFPTMILGLISSRIPILIFPLIPFIGVTTTLQYKTFKSYQKQKEERLENKYIEEKNNNIVFSKELSVKENLINLRNELVTYIYYDDIAKNKVRKKERKYDRY